MNFRYSSFDYVKEELYNCINCNLDHVPSASGFLHSTSWDDKIHRNSRRNALCLVDGKRGEREPRDVGGREVSASADTSMHTGEQRRMR